MSKYFIHIKLVHSNLIPINQMYHENLFDILFEQLRRTVTAIGSTLQQSNNTARLYNPIQGFMLQECCFLHCSTNSACVCFRFQHNISFTLLSSLYFNGSKISLLLFFMIHYFFVATMTVFGIETCLLFHLLSKMLCEKSLAFRPQNLFQFSKLTKINFIILQLNTFSRVFII